MKRRKKILMNIAVNKVNDVPVKLVIVRPSKIKEYEEKINEELFNFTVLYISGFHSAIEHLEHNSNRTYSVVVPNFFFDFIGHNANDFAKLVKIINPMSKVFCYSREFEGDSTYLDLVVSDYKKEDEIKVLIGLLK